MGARRTHLPAADQGRQVMERPEGRRVCPGLILLPSRARAERSGGLLFELRHELLNIPV